MDKQKSEKITLIFFISQKNSLTLTTITTVFLKQIKRYLKILKKD